MLTHGLQESVRHAIEGRLLDSSPAVRDASVELLGKYVVHKPALALKYLPRISERIAVGLFVPAESLQGLC